MEKILCAAICNPEEFDMAEKRLIYCGHRHNNILWQGKHISRNPFHQGFLTSSGRFVNREIAAIIAKNAGQIEKLQYSSTDLFSEDLY